MLFLVMRSTVTLIFVSQLFLVTPLYVRSHFAITHKPWVWKMIGSVHDFFLGASMLIWKYQHVFGHHPYTNIDGADPDIHTAREVCDEFAISKVHINYREPCHFTVVMMS